MMKNSFSTAAFLALLVAAGSLSATQPVDIRLSAGIKSDHYFRGQQKADSIIETEVSFVYADTYGSNYGETYGGVWFAEPFEAHNRDLGEVYTNELNVYLGQTMTLYPPRLVPVDLDIGLTMFYYPELPDDDNPTWEPYVGLNFDCLLAPAAYVFYDITLETWTVQGSVAHTMPIDVSSDVTVGAFAGYVSPDVGKKGAYYGLSAKYSYSLSSTAKVYAALSFTDGEDSRSGGNKDDGLSASLGISIGL